MRNHPIPYPHTDAEIVANPWEEISAEQYHEYLGAVPPDRMGANSFAMGESLCNTNDGGRVNLMCVHVGKKYYCKPERLSKFNPIAFANEVLAQLRDGVRMEQIVSKKPTMETFDVISGSCTVAQAKKFLELNPQIIAARAGMSIWWGAVRLS